MTQTNRVDSSGVYYIITAYSVTSAFTTDGDCVTVSGTPITLPTPFSVVPQSSPKYAEELESSINSRFATWLDYAPTCSIVDPFCPGGQCDFAYTPSGAVGFSLRLNLINGSNFDPVRAILSLQSSSLSSSRSWGSSSASVQSMFVALQQISKRGARHSQSIHHISSQKPSWMLKRKGKTNWKPRIKITSWDPESGVRSRAMKGELR